MIYDYKKKTNVTRDNSSNIYIYIFSKGPYIYANTLSVEHSYIQIKEIGYSNYSIYTQITDKKINQKKVKKEKKKKKILLWGSEEQTILTQPCPVSHPFMLLST